MDRVRTGPHGCARYVSLCPLTSLQTPSEIITSADLKDIFMLVLCFATPQLGCYDIFHLGSRTANQHNVEIGLRASTAPNKNGEFYLTTVINSDVSGISCYEAIPPTNSGAGLKIRANVVYSVLIIIDLFHSVIEYSNMDPSDGLPTLLYQSKFHTDLDADSFRPFAVSHRLELKESINHGRQWLAEFPFPGTISHCHQWQMEFPGQVCEWQEVHAAIQEEQRSALSDPTNFVCRTEIFMLETQSLITRHCLSLLVQVAMPVVFVVNDRFIEISFGSERLQTCGVHSLILTVSTTATEALLLNLQNSVCACPVTPWVYVYDSVCHHVPRASALWPKLIGGLIPREKERLQTTAFFWKMK